jgi:hypothetical protein
MWSLALVYAVLELPAMSFPNDDGTVSPVVLGFCAEFMWLFEVILYLTHVVMKPTVNVYFTFSVQNCSKH